MFYSYPYDPSWRLLEERIDASYVSSPGLDKRVQHVWGKRYIDDAVLHRRDRNNDGDYVDSTEGTWYHLTDAMYSTVALFAGASVIERVTYTPYGEARHHFGNDVDGDGGTDSVDQTIILGAWGTTIGGTGYRAEADLNRDGSIGSADLSIVLSYATAVAPGLISSTSSTGPDNPIGWDGYVFNPETRTYTVRNRTYLPVLGRWAQRDPAGYVDGLNLYQYAASHALGRLDAFGLQAGFIPDLEVDPAPCQQVCSAAFNPGVDPTGYVRCMAGCMNGLRGANCKTYCGRWTDPVEVAACEAGCDASKGKVGGNCVVACPVDRGPPKVLSGACVVAVATPVPGDEVVVGIILCGCVAYAILRAETIDIPIPRVDPIPLPRLGRPRWTCTIKPRGHCPSQCQSVFKATGATRAEAEAAARAQCYGAGCHQSDPNYNCNCGHVTCWVSR